MMDAQPYPACGEDSDGCYCPGVVPARRVEPWPHTSAMIREAIDPDLRALYAATDWPSYERRIVGAALDDRDLALGVVRPDAFTTDPTGRLTLRTVPDAE